MSIANTAKRNEKWGTLVIVVVFLATLAGTAWMGWKYWRGLSSKDWPQTKAKVVSFFVREFRLPNGDIKKRTADLDYRYTVGVQEYRGKRYSWKESDEVTLADIEEIKREVKQGGGFLNVAYNPSDPSISVVKTGPDPAALRYLLMGGSA